MRKKYKKRLGALFFFGISPASSSSVATDPLSSDTQIITTYYDVDGSVVGTSYGTESAPLESDSQMITKYYNANGEQIGTSYGMATKPLETDTLIIITFYNINGEQVGTSSSEDNDPLLPESQITTTYYNANGEQVGTSSSVNIVPLQSDAKIVTTYTYKDLSNVVERHFSSPSNIYSPSTGYTSSSQSYSTYKPSSYTPSNQYRYQASASSLAHQRYGMFPSERTQLLTPSPLPKRQLEDSCCGCLLL